VTRDLQQAAAGSFALLLKSRLEGAVLRAIETVAFERVLGLEFDTLEGSVQLAVELLGRAANAVLCVDDVIVGAMRTGGRRERALLPQRRYVRPSMPACHPLNVTARDLVAAAATDPRPATTHGAGASPVAWRIVLRATSGIGPALAWDACLRAGLDPLDRWASDAAPAIAAALRAIGERAAARAFAPQLYRDAHGTPVAYAPFPLACYATLCAESTSMSEAVEAVTARLADAAQREALRDRLASTVGGALARTRRAMAAVADDLRAAGDAEVLRQHGELILAYLSHIVPGAADIEVPDFAGVPVRIRLDPARTGVENARAYFKQYARATGARKRLPERQATLEADAAFLESAAQAIGQAESDDDLRELEGDLAAAGFRDHAARDRTARGRAARGSQARGSQARGHPDRDRAHPGRPAAVRRRSHRAETGRAFDLDGYQVRVGRSARENDYLTFTVAGPDDLWLHARGMPGAHVIVTGGGAPAEHVIATAAGIAAFYSAGRASTKVPVDVAARRHVRRTPGGRPGQVHYTHERTLMVTPAVPAPLR
jgi:predicted ribosome quality control (RQC) complex YloA/Tae2 family protein